MDIRTLTPNLSVSGQITSEDVAELKAMGFKAIVGNRPDGEEAGQPEWADIASAAEKAGLATAYHPDHARVVERRTGAGVPRRRSPASTSQCWHSAEPARDRPSFGRSPRVTAFPAMK